MFQRSRHQLISLADWGWRVNHQIPLTSSCIQKSAFLFTFAKFRKANFSYVMSVRLYICPHVTTRLPLDGFSRNLIFNYFSKKTAERRHVSLKSHNNNGCCTKRPIDIRFRQKLQRKSKHILGSITFFLNRAVYETMWENTVERGRTQMTIWRMRIVCWIPKATNTHRQVV